jgi:dipeptidyl aminopeptidase/acylaminoacyl peptidase
VLRYEKRTKVYGAQFVALATATVREETVDDVLAAIALLRSRPEIDAGRIVVAGHSLGAMLAPMIAAERPDLAAIVMLAGVSRPLPPLIVEQVRYLAALNGAPDEQAKARIAAIEAEAAKAMAAKPGDTGPLILGAPPAYWADLNRYDAAVAAQKLTLPILLLHGDRDYQVTTRDHAALVSAITGKPNVTAQEFPRLNHLFMAGEGPSRPEEYQHAGHVDQAVVDAIVAFVMKAPAR